MEGTVTISIDTLDALRAKAAEGESNMEKWNEYLEYLNQFPVQFHERLKDNQDKLGNFLFTDYKLYINGPARILPASPGGV